MKRLYRLLPSELNQIQRQLYDNITNGRRSNAKNQFRLSDREGSLEGPFNLFVMFPDLGSILSNLGEFIRYESKLPSRLRELMILHIAVDFQSVFEFGSVRILPFSKLHDACDPVSYAITANGSQHDMLWLETPAGKISWRAHQPPARGRCAHGR